MPLLNPKRTILERILALFLTVSLISSSFYMYFGYVINRNALINGIDKRLLISAETVDQLVTPDFYDRCSPDAPVPGEEIDALPADDRRRQLVDQIRIFQRHADLQYLYTVMQDDRGRYFLPFGSASGFGVFYENPSNDIIEVLKNGGPPNPRTIADPEYGTGRAVLIRRTSPSGKYYLIGAEASLREIDQVKTHAFLTFLCISVISFFCVALVGLFLARRLSGPIRRLNDCVLALRESGFSPDIQMPDEMLEGSDQARDETILLARGIDLMQKELFRHVEELKTTTQRKERAESELRIAGSIQSSMLPLSASLPKNFPVDLTAFLKPAREAGGDLYDFIPLDGRRLFFAVGDVSGKGMPAALFMTMTLTLIRAGVRSGMSIEETMLRTNNNLCVSNDSCTFVTLLIGIYDAETGEVVFCNGGHNPPVLRRADGTVSYLKTAGNLLVGVMEKDRYKLDRLTLAPDESLILYSDGVTEAMNEQNEVFGEDRLLESVRNCPAQVAAGEIFSRIEHDVTVHVGDTPQSDDITILILKRI